MLKIGHLWIVVQCKKIKSDSCNVSLPIKLVELEFLIIQNFLLKFVPLNFLWLVINLFSDIIAQRFQILVEKSNIL